MFHLIGFIIFGLIVGAIARLLTPGRQHMGWGITAALGIIGSLAAGYVGRGLGWYGPDDGAGFVASTVGAIIVLAIYHMIARRRSVSSLGVSSSRNDRDYPRRVA